MNRKPIVKNLSSLNDLGNRTKKSKYLILMIIPAIIFYLVFCYYPMYGIIIAFKNYTLGTDIMSSPWAGENGLQNFEKIFNYPGFWTAFKNTVIIGVSKLLISFVAAILMALIINEIRLRFFKKTFQTIVTFPHFLSWVIVGGLILNIFGPLGIVDKTVKYFGSENGVALTHQSNFFLPLIFGSDVWKEAGWSCIIYLATMAGISPELYEAAEIDGASRLQKIWHITLPAIKPTAILLLILSIGGILSAGFDQIYNLYNELVYDVGDILDTYIYRATFESEYGSISEGQATAVGLFKSVVSFMLVITVDRIAKLCGERGII